MKKIPTLHLIPYDNYNNNKAILIYLLYSIFITFY